jgi:hypothetical protein
MSGRDPAIPQLKLAVECHELNRSTAELPGRTGQKKDHRYGSPSLPKYKLFEAEKTFIVRPALPQRAQAPTSPPRPPSPEVGAFFLVVRGNSERQSRRNIISARTLRIVAFLPHGQPIDLLKPSPPMRLTRHLSMRGMLQRMASKPVRPTKSRDGEFEYRIKNASETHERVARESELASDLAPGVGATVSSTGFWVREH